MDTRARSIVASCLVVAASAAIRAEAQLDVVSRRRVADAFDGYALEPGATLEAISALSPTSADARIVDADLRLERARAATDLWLVSRIDPGREDVAAELADAMDLPIAAIPTALREELTLLARGDRAQEASTLLEAITLAQAIDAGGSARFDRAPGPRRDALVVVAVGRALADGDDSELASMVADPCASTQRCAAPFARYAAPSRITIAALLEASAAIGRLDRAWRGGDPFARAAWSGLGVHRRRLDLHVHTPAPRLEGGPALAAAEPGGPPARVDLLVAVTARGVEIEHVPAVRVRNGRLEEATPAAPLQAAGAGERPSGGTPALVQRLAAIPLAPDAIVGVSATADASARDLERALASMVAARRAPRVVVERAADGSLRTAPIDVIDRAQAGAPGDVVVQLGPDASEAPVMQAALDARVPGRRVVLDPQERARASEILDAAFAAARDGDLVAIVRD